MKNLIRSVIFSLGFIGVVNAQIATLDYKGLMEAEKQLSEARKAVNEAKNQLRHMEQEAEAIKKRVEGFSNFDQHLKDEFTSLLNNLIRDINNVDLDSFLNIGGFDQNKPLGQGLKDQMSYLALDNENANSEIEALKKKQNQLNKLRQEFKNAETQQKREELANNIAAEQVQFEMSAKQAELEKKKIENETKAKEVARNRNYLNRMLYGSSEE